MPLETVDLCFRPGVNPVRESLRIQKLMSEGRADEVTLVGEQQRREMDAKAGVGAVEGMAGMGVDGEGKGAVLVEEKETRVGSRGNGAGRAGGVGGEGAAGSGRGAGWDV
jgi:hypothetical protein